MDTEELEKLLKNWEDKLNYHKSVQENGDEIQRAYRNGIIAELETCIKDLKYYLETSRKILAEKLSKFLQDDPKFAESLYKVFQEETIKRLTEIKESLMKTFPINENQERYIRAGF